MPERYHTDEDAEKDLNKIYKLNDDIFKSRAKLFSLIYNNDIRGTKIDKKHAIYIEQLRIRLDRLKLMRHDEIMRLYSNVKLTRSIPSLPPIQNKTSPRRGKSISKMNTNDKQPNESIPKNDIIIYPESVTDHYAYDIVASYRKSVGKSIDFRLHPLLVGEDSIETLVIGLDQFVKEHNCTLSFTDMDEIFDQSIYDASCDVFDFSSVHLLVSHVLVTANFQFELNLDYEKEFARSIDHMRNVVDEFRNSICNVLTCEIDYIRVFSIERMPNKTGKSLVNFGITTIDSRETEQYVQDLKAAALIGFSLDKMLQRVIPKEYKCTWKPLAAYFQIQSDDFDPQFNYDFRTPNLPRQLSRGNCSYYLPIGWYRFGLNVKHKYGGDKNWLSYINNRGEWAVAFHGTSPVAVDSIIQEKLLNSATKTNRMRLEAVNSYGEEVDRPGLYVATHCTNGADRYATPFTVTTLADKSEQFQIVFQCRIEPMKFTIHKGSVKSGEIWRIVDPKAIRPYGILIRKTTLS